MSTSATPPPDAIPTGYAARWTGTKWDLVEDHRQHLDSKGTKQGGTLYWLPSEGDDWQSQPRYTEDLGRFFPNLNVSFSLQDPYVLVGLFIGGLLPVIAEKLKVDPAVMASPLITTIVDTTTLLVYFNIARILLKI